MSEKDEQTIARLFNTYCFVNGRYNHLRELIEHIRPILFDSNHPDASSILIKIENLHENPEPTIKVSELRVWCEEKQNALAEPSDIYEVALFNFIDEILNKFCGGNRD